MGRGSKNRKICFRKREYVRILKWVVDCCLHSFGYRIRPYLRETVLQKGEMMLFCERGAKRFAIFYDYRQFREIFGECDYETQEAYAMASAAHEMRHYYQVRQLYAEVPREDGETIEAWRENHLNAKTPAEDGISPLEFYMQPMEMDAELFAYLFVAKVLERKISLRFIDDTYLSVLRNEYIRRYGADDEDVDLFDDEFISEKQNETRTCDERAGVLQ